MTASWSMWRLPRHLLPRLLRRYTQDLKKRCKEVSQLFFMHVLSESKGIRSGSCWAIHTRDYRIHNPQKSQILVTVPEMLAIMLLSPPLARVWTPRIKRQVTCQIINFVPCSLTSFSRIVLDEIHSIGQQEGGAVWEQIILLAPCPIM